MNPTGFQPSRVSALPLLSPGQRPAAKPALRPVSHAVREMLWNASRGSVPVVWMSDEWHFFVRPDEDKGNR